MFIRLVVKILPSLKHLKGVNMKNYLIPILQTILCLAIWGAIGALLALGF